MYSIFPGKMGKFSRINKLVLMSLNLKRSKEVIKLTDLYVYGNRQLFTVIKENKSNNYQKYKMVYQDMLQHIL